MPNPPFQPLTLSVEQKSVRVLTERELEDWRYAIWTHFFGHEDMRKRIFAVRDSHEALRQEAASLRQRLENAHTTIAALKVDFGIAAAKRSQAEAALEEMQKVVENFVLWIGEQAAQTDIWHSHAGAQLRNVVAELQRRRSAPRQEKA